jgi:predicted nucleic acid-binding protein
MIVFDANVLIGWADPDDNHHKAADQLVDQAILSREELRIHPLTLAEVLVGQTKAGTADKFKTALAKMRIHTIVDPECNTTEKWSDDLALIRAETGLKMPDAVVLTSAITLGAAIATFDDRLTKAAKTKGVRVYGLQQTA